MSRPSTVQDRSQDKREDCIKGCSAYFVGVSTHRNTKGASKTEIGELEIIVLVDEQILGLQITVKDPV